MSEIERELILSVLHDMKSDGMIRRHNRKSVGASLWVKRLPREGLDKPKKFKVETEDVSLKGIGFVSIRRLLKNERLVISIPYKEGGGMLVLSRVCFCRKLPMGGYRYGVEFEDQISNPSGLTSIPDKWLKIAGDAKLSDEILGTTAEAG
ncbi:MAG: PilZ domain-containing protein [Phycisphaerae bacterium]